MIFPITKTSYYAFNLINNYSIGTIHSVYRKTINIALGSHLIALQAAGSPLSPISLITTLSQADMEQLPVEVGQPVTFQNGNLFIMYAQNKYIVFSCANAEIHNLQLSPLHLFDSSSALLREQLLKCIQTSCAGGFSLLFDASDTINDNLMLSAAKTRLDTALRLFNNKDWIGAAAELSRLIGLGIGLTPSGDDFLCGVLAGITLLDIASHPFSQEMRKNISEHLCDTNAISGAFIACALENQFSLAVNSLKTESSHQEMHTVFSEIGHSSGIDTVCGIFFIFYLFENLF